MVISGNQGYSFSVRGLACEHIVLDRNSIILKILGASANNFNMARDKIIQKCLSLLENPETSSKELSKILCQDKVLSEWVISIAKCCASPPKACKLKEAIALLGFDILEATLKEFKNNTFPYIA